MFLLDRCIYLVIIFLPLIHNHLIVKFNLRGNPIFFKKHVILVKIGLPRRLNLETVRSRN